MCSHDSFLYKYESVLGNNTPLATDHHHAKVVNNDNKIKYTLVFHNLSNLQTENEVFKKSTFEKCDDHGKEMDITGTNHISVPDVCKNGLFYQTKSVS